jgi:lipopolysaccharide cholinephosphotransferase
MAQVSNFLFQEPECTYGYATNRGENIGSLFMTGLRYARAKIINASNNADPLSRFSGIIYGLAIGILSSPAAILGILIRGIATLYPHRYNPIVDSIYTRTSPAIVDQVYYLIEKLNAIADKHGLKYWATAGTLLGALRHKGMIPWDDDGDFAILESDVVKLKDMKEDLAAEGIMLEDAPLGLCKLKLTYEKRKELFQTDEEADLDFVTVQKDKQNRWIPSNDSYFALYPKEIFFTEEITSLQKVPFGPRGITVPVPKNAERFVQRVYGEDCLDYGLMTHSHKGFFGFKLGNFEYNPILTKQKVKIVDKDYAKGTVYR